MVLKSKRELLTDKFEVKFFLSLDSVCKNLTFRVAYIIRFSFLNIKSFTPQESQDKTGHVNIKETNAVVWVVLQKFFSKNENLL